MDDKKINIIIVGVSFFGQMASSQRVKNLFDPLLNRGQVYIINFIVNGPESPFTSLMISTKKIRYNIHNPFSILLFIIQSIFYFRNARTKGMLNIIYHYGYPSIEDILFLKTSQFIGYKIVYDIVENINFSDQSKSSFRMKVKNFTSKIMLKQIYKNGSVCFAISSDLVTFCKDICKDKIPVIQMPISVNIDFMNSFGIEKKRPENRSAFDIKVFYGGSFGYKDGLEYLIKGFELACCINKNIELLLTGKISKQTDGIIQKIISESEFKNRIHLLGYLSEPEYFSTLANADILIVPRVNSKYANAGFPFKLGEYLASGNAVICTMVGDITNYLENGKNAVLINAESVTEICDAIIKLSLDKSLRSELGIAGKETAAKYFSSELVSSVLWENIICLAEV